MGDRTDFRWFALPIMVTFAICVIYSIVALAQPDLVPFSNHPKEINAVVPEPTQPAAPPTTIAPSAPTLTLVAQNLAFDQSTLSALAGPLSVVLENEDNGTAHNVQFFQGSDASAPSVGQTDLATGPSTQSVSLNLQKGAYYYHCDVHPTTMFGTLTIS